MGQGVSDSRYKANGYAPASERVYALFPRTLPVASSGGRNGFETFPFRLNPYTATPNFQVQVSETNHLEDGNPLNNATVHYTLNSDLEVLNIGTSDIYDTYATQIYESGETDILADGKYIQAFKDSLLYWDGEKFVNEATMNKKYLEMIEQN